MSTPIKMSVELRPFLVPQFVTWPSPMRPRQDGITPPISIPLRDLDADTLSALCDEFRAGVFKMAGKDDPNAALTAERDAAR